MTLRSLTVAAALSASPAAADTLADDFLDLLVNTCLPALENAEVPDFSGMTPYDADNPDHHFAGPNFGDGFVADDPRLLIAFGERNGYRGCHVSFAVSPATGESGPIVDALETWIFDHIDGTDYTLIYNCAGHIVAGSQARNARGYFVRVLVDVWRNPEDDGRLGTAIATAGEGPEPPAEECIDEDGHQRPDTP